MVGRLAEDLHGIDIGLADWQCLGGLAMDWLIENGLVDWRWIGGLVLDW